MQTLTATYSPDDNKLRLYASSRLDAELYARVKKAGFSWAPRQELFVAPAWSPSREDLLIELAGEIEDESSTMEERASARADRFEGYSDRRASEAERVSKTVDGIASNIPFGQPILVGHHSEKRARKEAEKIERGMLQAARLWDTSAYWISRAQNAMRHASYKARPEVTARRIKSIESDRRKCMKRVDEARKFSKAWNAEGLTLEKAIHISNYMGYVTVQLEGERFGSSIWSLLTEGKWTADQAKEWSLKHYERVIDWEVRWIAHYDNRLAYERAFLAEVGGDRPVATGEEIKVGGTVWVGEFSATVVKVNKGAEKRVVSVRVDKPCGYRGTRILMERITRYQAPGAEPAEATEKPVEPVSKVDRSLIEERQNRATALKEVAKAGVKVVSANQLFPTPVELAWRMVSEADIQKGMNILEPSAGTGRIIDAIMGEWNGAVAVTAIEINKQLYDALMARDPNVMILNRDFLTWGGDHLYERVLMNPPFENAEDIKHIRKAFAHLQSGGRLVAICANGPRQQRDLKPWVEELGGIWEDLPEGTFESSGTNVRTALIVVDKP